MRTPSFLVLVSLVACGGSLQDADKEEQAVPSFGPSVTPEWVASVQSPRAVTVAGGRVYVTTAASTVLGEASANGELLLLREPGIAPLVLTMDKFGSSYGLVAADASEVVWSASDGRILAISALGGDARAVTQESSAVTALALDAQYVYYTFETTKGSQVKRVSRSGGQASTLAQGLVGAQGIAVGPSEIFVSVRGRAGARDGRVMKLAKDGSASAALAENLSEPCGIAYVPRSNAPVWSEVGSDVHAGLAGSCALASDGTSAFLGRAAGDAVMRADLQTRSTRVLSAKPLAGSLGGITADSRFVYWISGNDIVRVAK
jgi:hypothetical protein